MDLSNGSTFNNSSSSIKNAILWYSFTILGVSKIPNLEFSSIITTFDWFCNIFFAISYPSVLSPYITIFLFWVAFALGPSPSIPPSPFSTLLTLVMFWFFRLLLSLIDAPGLPAFSGILYSTNILRFSFLYLVLGYWFFLQFRFCVNRIERIF